MPDTALMQFLLYLYNFNLYKSLRGYLQAYNIRSYKFATTIFHFTFSIFNFMPEPYTVTVQYRY